jgi:iron(III) transport system permease protein
VSRTDAHYLSISRIGALVRALFCMVLLLPIILLGVSAYPGWDAFFDSWKVFDRIALYRLSGSVILTCWTVFFSLLLAFPVYATYLSLSLKRRRWILLLSLMPLSYPPFGAASAWMTVISDIEQSSVGRLLFERRGMASQFLYSQAGCGWILALCFWPIVFLVLVLSSQPMRRHVEAAQIYLSRWSMVRYVLWPAWRESLLIASMVIGCLCMLQFETPSLMQLRSYPEEIFTRFSIPENEWKALLLCLPYVLTALVLAFALRRAGRCIDSRVTDLPFTTLPPLLVRISQCISCMIFFLSIVIPLTALLLYAGSMSDLLRFIVDHNGRLWRSVFYALAGAVLIVLLGIWYTSKSSRIRSVAAPALFTALFACPGILIAAGWLRLRGYWPGMLPPGVGVASMLGAYATHRMLLGYGAGVLLWRTYGERQREFDSLIPLSWMTRLWRLYIPSLIRPAVIAIILTALLIWGDVAITILLHPPGGDSLVIEYFNLLHYGSETRTAAIGFLMLFMPVVFVGIVFFLMGFGGYNQND